MALTPYYFGSFNLNDGISYYVTEKPYDMVATQQSLLKIARLDGVKKSGSVVNERTIVLKIKVVGSSRITLEQALETLFQAFTLQQQPLQIYATDARYFIADCIDAQNTLLAGSPISSLVTATFVAQQPYALAPTQSTFTSGNISATASGGLCTFATQAFTGGGSIYAHPHLTIVQQGGTAHAWTSLVVSQLNDSQSITVTSSLPAINGDFLDIYCDPTLPGNGYTVQLNNSGVPILFSGVFPVQEPNSTSWKIVVGISGSGTVTLKATWVWTPRWVA